MKKNKKLLLFFPLLLVALASFTYFVSANEKEQAIDQNLMRDLDNLHYAPRTMNDEMSEKIYKVYLKRLDYAKRFLIQEDIDVLEKYKHSIDDDVNAGRFDFFDKSLDIVNKRIDEAQGYYKDILDKPFDFSKDEEMETNVEKMKFAKNKDDMKEAWRKSLKYSVLSRVYEMMDSQEKAKAKKDSAAMKNPKTPSVADTTKFKTRVEMEEDARKKILKSENDYFKRLKEITRKDRLSYYFNAITAVYDPHTEYFSPKEKNQFDAAMSGQFFGIGAKLQEKDSYISVTEIVPGSASYKQGDLKAGDVILKVAQAADEPVDIADMQLDDVVQLIRGKKGTEVRLTVKKPDGKTMVIPIVRDIVVMEETYAQSVVLKGKKDIGYIKLPGFYADFNGTGGRNCSRDVKMELEKLKAANVDGVILDLRYNGGGSLNDVVDMAGLFVDKGPMVQVKSRTGMPQMLEDRDPSITYSGPLTVLVNSGSASASEIMAAAIQDYKRGVIIGTSPSTFGKGTVQRVYDLDEMVPPNNAAIKPLGSVKITCQKFYRINGGATQLKGVIPDIILPDPYYLLDQGEKEQDYPMAWDEIAPAKYTPVKPDYTIEKLRAHSEERLKKNEGFAMLSDAAKRYKKQKDSTVVSLNYDKYTAEQNRFKAESKKLNDYLEKEVPGIDVVALKEDAVPASDTLKTKKNADWYKAIKKDIYLSETLAIMNEMK